MTLGASRTCAPIPPTSWHSCRESTPPRTVPGRSRWSAGAPRVGRPNSSAHPESSWDRSPASRGWTTRPGAASTPWTRTPGAGAAPTSTASTRRSPTAGAAPRSSRTRALARSAGSPGRPWASSWSTTSCSPAFPTSSGAPTSQPPWAPTPWTCSASKRPSGPGATPGRSTVRSPPRAPRSLAGDPHRIIELPGVYQQVRLACPEFDVVGLAFPGVPGLPHFGHTGDVAWAITNAMADYQDLYRRGAPPRRGRPASRPAAATGWEPAAAHIETIEVRGAGRRETVEVIETARGPVIAAARRRRAEPAHAGPRRADLGFERPPAAAAEPHRRRRGRRRCGAGWSRSTACWRPTRPAACASSWPGACRAGTGKTAAGLCPRGRRHASVDRRLRGTAGVRPRTGLPSAPTTGPPAAASCWHGIRARRTAPADP